VVLALRTGIPVREWALEDQRVIATAWDVLDESDAPPSSERQMSG
jgi:hypothetical protein